MSPTSLWMGSTYGWIRNWMGVENASIAVAEDPAWVGEMLRPPDGGQARGAPAPGRQSQD